MSPDSLNSGQSTGPERYGSPHYRGRSGAGPDGAEPHNGTTATTLEPAGGFDSANGDRLRLPSLDPAAPAEPTLSSAGGWLDGHTGSLVDHPLLRGLLLELPPKGSTPPPGWLDRWFEATRSILELLYASESGQ